MLNTTETEQKHTTTIQSSTNQNDSSQSGTINETVDKTPFRVYGDEEKGYSLLIGNTAITKPQASIAELIIHMDDEKWNITANMICLMVEILTNKTK